jgi:hypothetical protein
MRKLLLLLLLLASSICYSQPINRIAKTFYRSNPFIVSFSDFLTHLINDPTLENKKLMKKTDSTLFFLEGDYKTHRPFVLNDSRTHVILAEKEEALDSAGTSYRTVYVYQLIGYAAPGDEGLKEVKKEYERFCRKYKNGFNGGMYTQELMLNEKQTGEICNFKLYQYLSFYPVTVAWAHSKDGTNLYALTMRFIMDDNKATIPFLPTLTD